MKIKKQRRGVATGDKVRQLRVSDNGSPVRDKAKMSKQSQHSTTSKQQFNRN